MAALLLSIGITAVEAVRCGVSTCYAQITEQQDTDVFGKCKFYMYTFAPCLSWTVSLWAEPIKAKWPVLPVVPPVALNQQPTLGYSFLKIPHRCHGKHQKGQNLFSVSRPQQLPRVCWQILWRGSCWHTKHSLPMKWLEMENCTCSDPFRLDLSLINKPFSWADHTMSSERWAFLHTSAGRRIFSAHFSFGSTALEHSHGRYSPTAWTLLSFFCRRRCRNRQMLTVI